MIQITKGTDTEKNYTYMLKTIEMTLADEQDVIANLSNLSAMINSYVSDLNWCGFYLLKDNGDLVLGPFQGAPACVRIPAGKGVCQHGVSTREIILVDDVEAFPGHIACDSATRSELVCPIFKNGEVYGVLDLDSPLPARFTELEKTYMQQVCDLITSFLSHKI